MVEANWFFKHLGFFPRQFVSQNMSCSCEKKTPQQTCNDGSFRMRQNDPRNSRCAPAGYLVHLHSVDGSEIRRSPPGMYVSPYETCDISHLQVVQDIVHRLYNTMNGTFHQAHQYLQILAARLIVAPLKNTCPKYWDSDRNVKVYNQQNGRVFSSNHWMVLLRMKLYAASPMAEVSRS